MGDKDKSHKMLEAYNDVFSDIVNGLLFEGQPVTLENEFTDAATWSYYKASGELRDQERDVAKYWTRGNVCISLVGMENQTHSDPYMPIRVMSYDAAEYRRQIVRDQEDTNPSGNRRGNRKRICPILTMVIYLNHEEGWRGPTTLKRCLAIPPAIDPYIQDYGMNLFDIGAMSLEEINRRFHGDFRIIAEYYAQKRMNNNYQPRPQAMRHARAVMHMLTIMERDHRFEDSYNQMLRESKSGEEGEWTMCDVLDRVENRGVEKGRAEGRVQGRAEGRAEGREAATAEYIENMHLDGFTSEQIARALRLTLDKVTTVLGQRGYLQA